KDLFPINYWEATDWSLQVGQGTEAIHVPSFFEYGTGFTPEEGIRGELVYVGEWVEPEENVSGKIAVVDMKFRDN
ncbi:MAG: hypothetical protein AAF694_31235, partial [Bacteroidota bacterium]